MTLFGWVAQHAKPEKTLIAGTGADSVRECVLMTNRAAEMGYKAALVLPANYYKAVFAKPESQMLFFRAVADQAKIPVILYHFPQVSGMDLAPETVAALASHPNIIGMKDSSGNFEGTKKFIAAVPKDFYVMTGSAPALAPSLAAGMRRCGARAGECAAVCVRDDLGSAPFAVTRRQRRTGRIASAPRRS